MKAFSRDKKENVFKNVDVRGQKCCYPLCGDDGGRERKILQLSQEKCITFPTAVRSGRCHSSKQILFNRDLI